MLKWIRQTLNLFCSDHLNLCESAQQLDLRESWFFNILKVSPLIRCAENRNKALSCAIIIMFINKVAISHGLCWGVTVLTVLSFKVEVTTLGIRNKFWGCCIELRRYAVFSELLLYMWMIKWWSFLSCAVWKSAEFSGLITVLHRCEMEIRPTELL